MFDLLITCLLTQPLAIFINTKLYRNTTREKHQENGQVIQCIIKHYSIIQLISWPTMTLFIVMFYICDTKLEIISESVARSAIHGLRLFYGGIRDYLSFNSLIVAVVRYTFLVFATKVEAFGIKRLRNFFLCSSFAVPICCTLLYEITQPMEQYWISVMRSIVSNNTGTNMTYHPLATDNMNQTYESPIYLLLNQNLPPSVMQVLSVTGVILMIIIYSNVIEGVLYAHAIFLYRR